LCQTRFHHFSERQPAIPVIGVFFRLRLTIPSGQGPYIAASWVLWGAESNWGLLRGAFTDYPGLGGEGSGARA
jgi:hypothetical protein